jgi:pimeloyl-ACP methyl ester carboxylesterase
VTCPLSPETLGQLAGRRSAGPGLTLSADHYAKMIPGAKLSVYQGIGHAPFFEDAPRFNAELAAFVRSAQK